MIKKSQYVHGRRVSLKRIIFALSFLAVLLGPTLLLDEKNKPALPKASGPKEPNRISATKKSALQQVEALNAQVENERKIFIQDGWNFVDSDEPDIDVTDLNPHALPNKEDLIFEQLQTNSYSGSALDRAAEIALLARQERTRYAALDVLGRSHDPQAQILLISLYPKVPTDASRSQILPLIRPEYREDERSLFLLARVADDLSSEETRHQSEFSLALLYLRKGWNIEDLVVRLPVHRRDEFRTVHRVVAGGLVGHKH